MKPQQKSLCRNIVIGLAALLASTAGMADVGTTLTGNISMDNGFVAYISTSDSVQGTQFFSGNDWTSTFVGATNLAAGTDYFLHIRGYDQGGVAGFLGQFSLTGATHQFSNGLASLLTNTTDWRGNTVGFNGAYSALGDLGVDGVGPWGNRPNINDNAHWIWSGDATGNDNSYFSTRISAIGQQQNVPEPASLALLGLGLAGLAASRRRKAA